eukprot:CAMPEP_0182855760 /NCGR_PEP_ID=MMETSP0034_2-20130328/2036_1 /TAXON_ID=156128 /ORGANISM="Nephroselmis pyriformis, Strain CCMP717" /LENGTH=478 /DNA_ID=CAMNT_0024986769 /DNA_START=10 /DNA_END=1446 /DNA_ORIENTATION=+
MASFAFAAVAGAPAAAGIVNAARAQLQPSAGCGTAPPFPRAPSAARVSLVSKAPAGTALRASLFSGGPLRANAKTRHVPASVATEEAASSGSMDEEDAPEVAPEASEEVGDATKPEAPAAPEPVVATAEAEGDKGGKGEKRQEKRGGKNDKRPEQVPQDDPRTPPGSIVSGTVVWSSTFGAEIKLLDYDGPNGFLPAREGPYMGFDINTPQSPPRGKTARQDKAKNKASMLPKGLTRRFRVMDFKNRQGGPMLSARSCDMQLAWNRVQEIAKVVQEDKETLKCEILGTNRGGCVTTIEGLRAFIPKSHLGFPRHSDPARAEKEAESCVGTTMELTILDADPSKNNLLCSVKVAENFSILKKVYPGAVVNGVVRQVMDYGVFVGVEGTKVSGLLHVSNISRLHVGAVGDVFQDGDKIKALVLDMAEDGSRISLSTAELEEEDGQMLEDPAPVYERAEENASYYREHLERQMNDGGDYYE